MPGPDFDRYERYEATANSVAVGQRSRGKNRFFTRLALIAGALGVGWGAITALPKIQSEKGFNFSVTFPFKLPDNSANPTEQKQEIKPKSLVSFGQLDEQWKGNYGWGTGKANSAPTAFAMILSSYGVETTPVDVNKEFLQAGLKRFSEDPTTVRISPDRSKPAKDALGWLEQKKGFEVVKLADEMDGTALDLEEAKKKIGEGYLLLTSFVSPWAKTTEDPDGVNHVMVVTKVDLGENPDSEKKFSMLDPFSGNQEVRGVPQKMSYMYAVRPKQPLKNG